MQSKLGPTPPPAPPPKRQDPKQKSIQEACPLCARMQTLMNQMADIADVERRKAESYKNLYDDLVRERKAEPQQSVYHVPPDGPKAA